MLMEHVKKEKMPDVTTHSSSQINSKIDWVGMDGISLPVIVNGEHILARVSLYVNILDPSAKGIHMSRLYLVLGKTLLKQKLTVKKLKDTVEELVQSQKGLSDHARLEMSWQQPINRKALISDYEGWKGYPVKLKLTKSKDNWDWQMNFATYYSSTCPCSAALARQLFQDEFQESFENKKLHFEEILNWIGEKQVASAHSQRSRADVKLKFEENKESIDFLKYIDAIEQALRTPVQTAVKRADEQEFARLNGENMMFVEDALRKMKEALEKFPELKDFAVKARHFESLHAHDAAGMIRK